MKWMLNLISGAAMMFSLAGYAAAGNAAVSGGALCALGSLAPVSVIADQADVPAVPLPVPARRPAQEFAAWNSGVRQTATQTGFSRANYYSGNRLPLVQVVKQYKVSGWFSEFTGEAESFVGGAPVAVTVSQDLFSMSVKGPRGKLTSTNNPDILTAVIDGRTVKLSYQGKDLVAESLEGVTVVSERPQGGSDTAAMVLSGANSDVNIMAVAYMLALELQYVY